MLGLTVRGKAIETLWEEIKSSSRGRAERSFVNQNAKAERQTLFPKIGHIMLNFLDVKNRKWLA